jgi:hypothetical protein
MEQGHSESIHAEGSRHRLLPAPRHHRHFFPLLPGRTHQGAQLLDHRRFVKADIKPFKGANKIAAPGTNYTCCSTLDPPNPPLQDYVTTNQWVFWASWITAFGLIITMSCSNRVRRKFPLNMIFLVIFTLVFSVVAATTTARYHVRAIGLALAVTSGTVLGAFCVAAFTKLDLTRFGGFLFAVLMGVVVMSIVGVFWRNTCAPPACVHFGAVHVTCDG